MQPRKLAWIVSSTLPIWAVPAWIYGWNLFSSSAETTKLESATGCLLLAMTGVAAYTDYRWRLIPNWITYPGALWGLGLNLFQSVWGNSNTQSWLGAIGIGPSLLGLVGLFIALFVIFTFSGGGAGDVKLVGAMGSMLGFWVGGEAVMVSFIICAVIVLLISVSSVGLWRVLETLFRKIGSRLLPWYVSPPSGEQVKLLKTQIPQAPFFAAGTLLIVLRESGLMQFSLFGIS
jgi:prepilin peptidase CpaA